MLPLLANKDEYKVNRIINNYSSLLLAQNVFQ